MATGADHDDRPRVHVLDSWDTTDIANDIIRGLDRVGIDGTAPLPSRGNPVHAVVVLLSAPALHDPTWIARAETLRHERLVPVRVSPFEDDDVPEFLAELNWIDYAPGDDSVLGKLFTGINTDATRFRDARDTRSLVERWANESLSDDYLLSDLGDVKRRLALACESVDGGEPLISAAEAQRITPSFRERYRFYRGTIEEENAFPRFLSRTFAVGAALFSGIYDDLIVESLSPVAAFLVASRRHATTLRNKSVRRIALRVVLAGIAALTVTATVILARQAVTSSNNAVSFAFGDSMATVRPDIAAFKAGGSLIDTGAYTGDDGRLRIAVDALSQHWQLGYVTAPVDGIVIARILEDGSIVAADFGGALWTWDPSLTERVEVATGFDGVRGGDVSADGSLAALTDGSRVVIVVDGVARPPVEPFEALQDVRLAPATDRMLISTGGELFALDGVRSGLASPTPLDGGDAVLDVVQTEEGRAVGLVREGSSLRLVRDDGQIQTAGTVSGTVTAGAIASDGVSFALIVDGAIWTSTADGALPGTLQPSGIVVPGVSLALRMTHDGFVLVSDRTRGSWVADPRLGVSLGSVCPALPGVREFVVDASTDTFLCLQSSLVMVDSLADVRPTAIDLPPVSPVTEVRSSGPIARLSIVDDLIRADRADGRAFAIDSASISFAPGFERPASIADVDLLSTGAFIGANALATTLAITDDGSTFAIGFVDGSFIEVDVNSGGGMARVGGWQAPDHSPIASLAWSDDRSMIVATTQAGTTWQRESCSGCWSADTLIDRIAERVWTCYPEADIANLGDTVRSVFGLRSCEALWGQP